MASGQPMATPSEQPLTPQEMAIRRATQNPKKEGPFDLFEKNKPGALKQPMRAMGAGGQPGMGFGMRPKLPPIR